MKYKLELFPFYTWGNRAQKGRAACLRLHSKERAELEFRTKPIRLSLSFPWMTFLCWLSDKTQSNTQIWKTKQGKVVVYVCANLGGKFRCQGKTSLRKWHLDWDLKGPSSYSGAQKQRKAPVKKSVLVCETETPAWLWLDLKCGR